jgi:hypothetical protein
MAIGIVATVALLSVLFATGVLVYDRTMVQTMPFFVSQNVVHTPFSIEASTHFVATAPLGLAILALPITGLFAGLSYVLFARRMS